MTRPDSVVILGDDAPRIAPLLSQAVPNLTVQIGGDAPISPYAVIAFGAASELERYRDASWVHINGAGADGILAVLDRAQIRPALITRTVGQMGRQIGEYVLSYLLADAQCHDRRAAAQKTRSWDRRETAPAMLAGQRAAIFGTGGIGSGVADTLSAIGVECEGISRSGTPQSSFRTVHAFDNLPQNMIADLVIAALPLTPDTQACLDRTVFDRFDGVLFINVGRGATVEDAALLQALETGAVRRAVLDVFAEEPLPDSSPFWDHPRIMVTPHISGLTRPEDTVAGFLSAYRAVAQGRRPDLTVDPRLGY